MVFISTLADIGFLLPLLVVSFLVLAAQGNIRIATCWFGAIFLTIGVVSLIKFLLRGDPVLPHFPSGHVALAVSFYGGLFLILGQKFFLNAGFGFACGLVILAVIAVVEGVSRVKLTQHTWVDVAGGFFFGTAALAAAGYPWAWRFVTPGSRMMLLFAIIVACVPDILAGDQLDRYIREVVPL
jgi:membrane-associated phospholipid phosphatase